MREDIELEPEKFIISSQEFDAFLYSKPDMIEDGSITTDNFETLIADYEVKFSKELVEETEELETNDNPKEVETKEEVEEVEDDEADPEVTLD